MERGILRLVLVGGTGRRLEYFTKAATGMDVCRYSWEAYPAARRRGDFVKLEPPDTAPTTLGELPGYIADYRGRLVEYAGFTEVTFLNHPVDIAAALDKHETKRRLVAAGIPTPPPMAAQTYPQLLEEMDKNNTHRVFVKPRFGAGATGVVAFSCRGDRQLLYTSLGEGDGTFYNTKRIHQSRDPDHNRRVLEAVFAAGAVAERWVPKAMEGEKVYDLRVVWQFDGIAAVVARDARGPITNLHLNNMARAVTVPPGRQQELEQLCRRTMEQFPRLAYSGIDVLVPKGSSPLMILEVNGQGDLIHQDIYKDNIIYSQQVSYIKGQTAWK